jgi:hypothetical protein
LDLPSSGAPDLPSHGSAGRLLRIMTEAMDVMSVTILETCLPTAVAMKQADGSACPGTALPEFTADQVRASVFEELAPNNVTLGFLYNKCSYGSSKINMTNSLVADTVELPCNSTQP